MSNATVNGLSQGTCPHCGSTDTATLKVIVANGTTRGTTRGTTTGWVDGSGGQPGHTATFTTQRTTTLTAAARAATAPHKRWNGVILIIIGIAVGGFGGWVGYALAADRVGSAALDVGIPLVVGTVLVVWGMPSPCGRAHGVDSGAGLCLRSSSQHDRRRVGLGEQQPSRGHHNHGGADRIRGGPGSIRPRDLHEVTGRSQAGLVAGNS